MGKKKITKKSKNIFIIFLNLLYFAPTRFVFDTFQAINQHKEIRNYDV